MTETGATGIAEAPPRRWPRWMGVALIASLALNLVVVGAIGAAAWRHHRWPEPSFQPSIFGFTRTLSGDRRHEILQTTREHRRELRPFRAALRKARADVRAALVARPFDPDRYRHAHAAQLAAEQKARGAAQQLLDQMVLRLTDEERARLAHWLARGERPWRRHGSESDETREDGDEPPTDGATKAVAPAKP
ncbi:MAG: periplasmic heavy metal sensor [Hyphomicrobiaceae bacterium]|nr:periplasmic heavy metal sensor [Hyphomicrobiaceae bacterium]